MKKLIAVAIVSLALAPSAGTVLHDEKIEAFEATAVSRRIETHLPPRGRAGDRDLIHWVINDRFGRSFGSAMIRCDWYRTGERMCVGVFRLARGSFVVAGTSQNRAFGEFIVLRGTGDYADPKGLLTFNATREGKLSLRGSFDALP